MIDSRDEKISVIVPVYNVENYVKRCVDSITGQSYKYLEIILVDDGSTDASGLICDELAKKDKRITVIHKDNGGLSDARNVGIQHASGEFFAFVDSDDWIEFDMYETLYALLREYDADIAMCNSDSVDCDGKRVVDGAYPQTRGDNGISVYVGKEIMRAHLMPRKGINAGVWNKLYKRTIIEGIEFPKSRLYEDVFTTYRYLDRAQKVVKINAHKYNYFQREGSICSKPFSNQNFDSIVANKFRYDFISNKYPELEFMARQRVLVNLLNVGFRLAKTDQIEEFNVELAHAIKETHNMSLKKCGLNKKQQWGIRIMRSNLKLFSIMVRTIYL